MNRREADLPLHTPRSRALGMHLILMLVTCLLASQVLLAHEGALAPTDAATPWGGDYFPNTLLTDQDGQQVLGK